VTDEIDTSDATCADFKVGCRVQLHPCADSWMQGDRYGEVIGVYPIIEVVQVRMDVSKRSLRFHPKNILKGEM
jgi:hypothetical protein